MPPVSTPIGIAVLSFVHGHANAYCERIQTFDDARVVAAWDDNAARGQAACEKWHLDFVPDLAALFARPDVQAVIITSETNRHADLVEAACQAGKHILCQKPMATTLLDCDRIIRAVDQAGVQFSIAFQMRCDPLNQQVKTWIEEGAVGRIGAIRRRHCINFLWNEGLKHGPNAWHIDAQKNVGMFFDWETFDYALPATHAERIKDVPRPWIDSLKLGMAPQVSARDGKVSVEMCLAAYRSAREGRRILFEEQN